MLNKTKTRRAFTCAVRVQILYRTRLRVLSRIGAAECRSESKTHWTSHINASVTMDLYLRHGIHLLQSTHWSEIHYRNKHYMSSGLEKWEQNMYIAHGRHRSREKTQRCIDTENDTCRNAHLTRSTHTKECCIQHCTMLAAYTPHDRDNYVVGDYITEESSCIIKNYIYIYILLVAGRILVPEQEENKDNTSH